MSEPMRARTLSSSELAFSWRSRQPGERLPEAALEVLRSLRMRVGLNERRRREVEAELGAPGPTSNSSVPSLPIDEGRMANCNLSVAFGHVFDALCLAEPRGDDWVASNPNPNPKPHPHPHPNPSSNPKPNHPNQVASLRGRTVGFVGDSVLRDLFLFLCLVLSRSLRQTSGAWAGRSLGRGTGFAGSVMRADFADGISLRWCWYNDAACVAHELLTVDLLVAHYGAHCAPLNGRCGFFHWPLLPKRPELRPASTDAPTAKAATRAGADAHGVSFAVADALRGFHARAALVWMEYPAPHFREGLGEFEDYWLDLQRHNASRARPGPTPWHARPFSCQPLGECISAMSAWRLSFRDLFQREGVPLLRAWDVSLERSEVHPGQSPAPGLSNPAKRFTAELSGKRAPDCRHTCVPSSVVLAWSRLLFAMLQPTGINTGPSTDAGRCAELTKSHVNTHGPPDAAAAAGAPRVLTRNMAAGTPDQCGDAAAAVARERLSAPSTEYEPSRALAPHAEALEMSVETSCELRPAALRGGGVDRGASRAERWQHGGQSRRCACFNACASVACDAGVGGAQTPHGGRTADTVARDPRTTPPRRSKRCKSAEVGLICRRKCSYGYISE